MKKKAELIASLLEEHKVENIEIYDVSNKTPFTSYFVLGTCLNERQLNAMKETLEDDLAKNKLSIKRTDGMPNSGWVIVDEGDVMIHLFTKQVRETISLEELYKTK